MATAQFGDARLSRRLERIVGALLAKPSVGFPMAFGDGAACEGFYRFVRNGKVTSEAILEPHISATAERCAERDWTIVIHDTTQFHFGGESEREGLGTTNNSTQGFFAHFALAVDPELANRPLGVLGLSTISRTEKKYSRGDRAAYLRRLRRDPNKESLRWGELVERVEKTLANRSRAIHVMDRESDSYVLLARMQAIGARFVIRVTQKRKLFPADLEPVAGVYEDWQDLPDMVEREVPLSARRKSSPYYCAGRHPLRGHRIAKLRFAAKRIRAKRCSNISWKSWPAFLELNAVRVYEVDPPNGEEPVEWLLLTTEPITRARDVERIVDTYRARWIIEEYFKALKTGCSFERRQLESYATLKNALAILAPIAARMLLLRSLERDTNEARVRDVVTVTELEVLREFSPRPPPLRATVAAVMKAIAALGGHLSSNGPPGWQVLWRGYQEMLTLERAWSVAQRRTRSDQS